MRSLRLAAALVVLAMAAPEGALARDQIRIVGSSTVYPFSTVVAEEFGRSTAFKAPIVESTGTGGGLKLFCGGVGLAHPDITNASRRIKQSELELCASNGVEEITEVMIGYDGIVLANSKKSAVQSLTLRQVFLALAKEVPAPNGELVPNPEHVKWSDIDPSLPERRRSRCSVRRPPPARATPSTSSPSRAAARPSQSSRR